MSKPMITTKSIQLTRADARNHVLFGLPPGSYTMFSNRQTEYAVLLELQEAFNQMQKYHWEKVPCLWLPPFMLQYLEGNEGTANKLASLKKDYGWVVQCLSGLQCGIAAYCTEVVTHAFIGYPTGFNHQNPDSVRFIVFSPKLRNSLLQLS